jgi:hypothetical protein
VESQGFAHWGVLTADLDQPTDLSAPDEDLVTGYAWRWAIEVAFFHARQVLGVGQTRKRTRQAVERTVPFGCCA